MKNVPFSAAKEFCEAFEKDQVIILSWDEKSNTTWVTTYGVGDKNSIQAANAGALMKDYLKLKREKEEIPERFKVWKIESVDRYYYCSGRDDRVFCEVTFWFEEHTMERKETKRDICVSSNNLFTLPDWAKSITTNRKMLND